MAGTGTGLKALFIVPDRYHGRGKVIFQWNATSTFMCSAGSNGLVHIFDRQGTQITELQLESRAQCLAIDWDKDGESVAILQTGVDRVAVWEVNTRSVVYIDTGLKDPTFMKWSRVGPQLAIGSSKGGLVIFRKDSRKKLPITGKHSKAILCGDWSRDNRLALGGADNVLTISTADGDAVEQTELKYAPQGIQFASQKMDRAGGANGSGARAGAAGAQDLAETTISVNMGGKTILLYNIADPDHPIELAFQQKYGRVVAYRWFGEGYLMIGFSDGYLVVISTHIKEIGEELFCGKYFRDSLDDIACSTVAQRAASAGGNMIKMVEMSTWKELKNEFAMVDAAHGPIDSIQWTSDGQILTAATRSGHVYAFLARVPVLVDSWGSKVACLSSLKEVTVTTVDNSPVDSTGASGNDSASVSIEVPVEPMLLAVGSNHVGSAVNNKVFYHRLRDAAAANVSAAAGRGGSRDQSAAAPPIEKDYLGTVDVLRIGEFHAAALVAGSILVHAIEPRQGLAGSGGMKRLPERDDGIKATCLAIAGDFLFYGTSSGTLHIFSLVDWALLPACEMRLEGGRAIKGVFPNPLGTRVVVFDDAGRTLLYNPVDARLLLVPDVPPGSDKVLWDTVDRGVFLTSNGRELATYLYSPVSMTGPSITQLGSLTVQPNGDMVVDPLSTPVPSSDAVPLALADGIVSCYTPSSGIQTTILATHEALQRSGRVSNDRLRAAFAQNVALLRLNAAWHVAVQLNDRACWLALSGKAMESLDVELAQRVYRRLSDAGMVQSLELMARTEDRQAAAGHMALLFGDYPLAQELFLSSSEPVAALEMRKDLLEWDTALKLAETLAPQQVPPISLELAKQLEFKGDYAAALQMYQQAQSKLSASVSSSGGADGGAQAQENERLREAITAGAARMTLRVGDVRKGMQMALDSGSKQLCKECAAILEGMKQHADAATLYKKAEAWEKAVSLLITSKNFAAAAPLMDRVSAPKLHSAYAKAKEAGKEYAEAVKSYERARDMDAVVRLLLNHLNQPERAAEIVRHTRSADGAGAIANFCRNAGDFRGAIEFLLLAKRREDAFTLACDHNEMGLYVQALRTAIAATDKAAGAGPSASEGAASSSSTAASQQAPLPTEECLRIAQWYEGKGQYSSAAEMYAECGQYSKAMSLYIKCNSESELPRAIEVAAKAKIEAVTHTLIDYLIGESDGNPKNPQWVFKLYLALGETSQACKTALIIAETEQKSGNYKNAHAALLETYTALEAANARIPRDLLRKLTLLHSYLLVKRLVKAENHEAAARMCVRVAHSISSFPAHIVPILTSTVIECQRAGLKKSAFEYACMLMRPEYREQVDEKWRKKLEALVRRPSDEEVEDTMSDCPFCTAPVPASSLSCDTCKSTLPFDILTGRHMVADDVSSCPHCHFPASFAGLASHAQSADPNCPMCGVAIAPSAVVLHADPIGFLRKAAGSGATEDEGDEAPKSG